jgi:hypothetical protein
MPIFFFMSDSGIQALFRLFRFLSFFFLFSFFFLDGASYWKTQISSPISTICERSAYSNNTAEISKQIYFFLTFLTNDRLCGLVVIVHGYRFRDVGFDSRRYQIFWQVVGLTRDPLSLVKITEELLEWKSSGSGYRKSKLTAVGFPCADHATPSIR